MLEFRCSHSLHARVTDEGLVEVACKSRWCGKEPGVVILHRFNLSGELVETLRFKAPPTQPEQGRKPE